LSTVGSIGFPEEAWARFSFALFWSYYRNALNTTKRSTVPNKSRLTEAAFIHRVILAVRVFKS
jgi:hypothetical protein